MTSFLDPLKWILGLGLIASLGFGMWKWETHIRADERTKVVAEYNVKIDAQKVEAAKLLEQVTTRVAAAEKVLRTELEKQNVIDQINEKTISVLADKLHGLASRTGGVFIDPNSTGRWQSSDSPSGSTAPVTGTGFSNITAAAGVLSKFTTDALLTLARQADELNAAYESCRNDSIKVRQ
jgi:hypothetical protein